MEKIGVVAMPNISVGGGFARVARDLIASLNSMGKKVYLLTPFKLDLKKIEEFHGPIKLEGVYTLKGIRSLFYRPDGLARRAIKSEFQRMANDVDLIIDIDGKVLHKYLPKSFDKSKYIIWRVSCAHHGLESIPLRLSNSKALIKQSINYLFDRPRDRPTRDFNIYAIDTWTRDELIKNWDLTPSKNLLYAEIKVDDFLYKGEKKKDQVIIFGRIVPNKSIDESLKIFAYGTKKYPDYKLIIMGGLASDSKSHINYLKRVARDLGVSNRVKIIGDPSFADLQKILKESKVLIDSQYGVSITLTGTEALAAGCMVLATRNAGTYKETLDNGKYGFGFDSIKEGAQQLEKILDMLKGKKYDYKKYIKRTEFFNKENFDERLTKILNGI